MSRAGRAPFHPCPVQKLGALASRYFVEPPPPGLPLRPVGPARPFVVGRAEAWAVSSPRGAARARELREAVADGAEACLWLCIVVIAYMSNNCNHPGVDASVFIKFHIFTMHLQII